MMDITDTIEGVKGALGDKLSAQVAYGEPVVVDGTTVIPVARVMLGFGAGGGVGEPTQSGNGEEEAVAPVGGGGGGGGVVQPLGFIEIDATGARWVAIEPSRAELGLRALMMVAVLLPFGGRRGLIGRFIMLLIGQAIAGRISQPNLPSMDSFRSRVSV